MKVSACSISMIGVVYLTRVFGMGVSIWAPLRVRRKRCMQIQTYELHTKVS